MKIEDWLFSFHGRMGRIGQWIAFPLILTLYWATIFLIDVSLTHNNDLTFYIAISISSIVWILTTWAAFAVTFKRAHDRGYSGFISLLPGAVIAVTFFLGSIGGGGDLHVMLRQFNQVQRGIQITNSQLYSILLFGKICWYSVTLWLFIELWLRPGEACDNRFGPAKRRAVGAPLAN